MQAQPPEQPLQPEPPQSPQPPPSLQPTPNCLETANHGCVSLEEFGRLRDSLAAVRLADGEFRGSSSRSNLLGQRALETVNVHQAHAALAIKYGAAAKPGDGVRVGIMDSGVDSDHHELADADISETFLQGLPDERRADYGADGYSHGTAVTSIMAAQPNRAGFLGIAWGATYRVFTVPIGAHIPGDDPLRNAFEWDAAYRSVLASGVDIVNASYSTGGTFIENFTPDRLRNSASFGPEFDVIAQRGVPDPAIFVWPAGNDHGDPCDEGERNCFADDLSSTGFSYRATSPNLGGGAVARLPELQGHNVVVVAVDQGGGIADFSNRCGIAGPWCIAAPGTGITGAEFGRTAPGANSFFVLVGLSGTSYASPLVSGGLALMKHFFRGELSNRELVSRLFETADKSGRYAADRSDGTSSIYGQGLMDLGAAVSPVDSLTVPIAGRAGNAGHSMQTTRLTLGPAFGDGLVHSLAGREIAGFDALGAPFWFDLPGILGTSRPSAAARLRSLVAPEKEQDPGHVHRMHRKPAPDARPAPPGSWSIGLHQHPAGAGGGLPGLAGPAMTMTFGSGSGLESRVFTTAYRARGLGRETGASLAWRPRGGSFGLRVGWLAEDASVLGLKARGAFGRLAADNLFTGFEAVTEIGGWQLALDAEAGLTRPSVEGGLIDDLSSLTTSALSLRGHRRLTGRDALTLSLSQPLRIERGSAKFRLPVGRAGGGDVRHATFSADLAPRSRQVDLTVRWRRDGLLGGVLQVEAEASRHPGHAATGPAFSLLAGWRTEF